MLMRVSGVSLTYVLLLRVLRVLYLVSWHLVGVAFSLTAAA